MAAARSFVLPAIMAFLVFSAVAVCAARPLAGEELSGEAGAGKSIVRRPICPCWISFTGNGDGNEEQP
nr:unnamed protein product [Digitaria exilis]